MIKLKQLLLKEELIGKYSTGIDIYKNPKSISRMSPGLRAISFPSGDLFVCDDNWGINHIGLEKWLKSNDYSMPAVNNSINELFSGIKKGYISWQRMGDTNDFYLSRSIEFGWFKKLFNVDKKEIVFIMKKYILKIKSKNPKYNFVPERIGGD